MRAHTSCLSLLIVVPYSVYDMPGERGHASNAWNKEASRKLDTRSGHWLGLDTSPECCAIHAPRALRASGVLGKEIKYYQNGPGGRCTPPPSLPILLTVWVLLLEKAKEVGYIQHTSGEGTGCQCSSYTSSGPTNSAKLTLSCLQSVNHVYDEGSSRFFMSPFLTSSSTMAFAMRSSGSSENVHSI